jgi:hypothetical protein
MIVVPIISAVEKNSRKVLFQKGQLSTPQREWNWYYNALVIVIINALLQVAFSGFAGFYVNELVLLSVVSPFGGRNV